MSGSIWVELLKAIVRHALTFLAAWLVAQGVIDENFAKRFLDEGTAQLVGWAIAGGAFLWSAYKIYRKRLNLAVAAEAQPTTVKQVKKKANALPAGAKLQKVLNQ